MEGKYFTRSIKEGTVKREHVCSFDPSIKLQMVVTGSHQVLDYLVRAQAVVPEKGQNAQKKAEQEAKENIMRSLAGLRINGLPIVYEDLDKSFDSEEILEVMAFINGADMSVFGGSDAPDPNA